MKSTQFIVCESQRTWATALRRRWLVENRSLRDLPLRECRNLAEGRAMLSGQRASLIAMEVREADIEELLGWLPAVARMFPQARSVALVQGANRCRDQVLREAGVIHIASATREIGPVLGLFRRLADKHPPERLGVLEEIESSLPWHKQ